MLDCELTQPFGGVRVLSPHRLPNSIIIDRAVNNVARDLTRYSEKDNPAWKFVERVRQKAHLSTSESIKDLNQQLLGVIASPFTSDRILHTICLMTSGLCDLYCEQCYTEQAVHQGNWRLYESAIKEAQSYGARIVYVAGEGEPFLDNHIGDIIRLATRLDMEILMFSNGLQFCHETVGYRKIRARIMNKGSNEEVDIPTFVKWLSEFPVHIYLKMHSSDRDINSRLCGLSGKKFNYSYKVVEFGGRSIDVPAPILDFPKMGFPIERLGFEAMLLKETAEDVLGTIGPWSQMAGYALYAEPFIPSGRIRGDPSPTFEQIKALHQAGYLVRQDCSLNKIVGKIVVSCRGFLSPILAFTWRQLQNRPDLLYDEEQGFMGQRDSHPLFQLMRYEAGCPCSMGRENLEAILDKYAPRK